jgi:hypothetical protein
MANASLDQIYGVAPIERPLQTPNNLRIDQILEHQVDIFFLQFSRLIPIDTGAKTDHIDPFALRTPENRRSIVTKKPNPYSAALTWAGICMGLNCFHPGPLSEYLLNLFCGHRFHDISPRFPC